MRTIQKILIASLLIFLSPTVSQAQTTYPTVVIDEAYRQQLIELLLQQIAVLQAELDARSGVSVSNSNTRNFDSLLLPNDKYVVALYKTGGEVVRIRNQDHQEIFNRFLSLVPDQYDDYFHEFLVFDNDDIEFDAFVETIPPYEPHEWRLGLSESVINDVDSNSPEMSELLIHEFGHIVSYETIPGVADPRIDRCHEYFDRFGCPEQNTYLYAFYKQFWSRDDLDTAERIRTSRRPFRLVEEFYEDNRNDFVSEYAASSPEEDFAESFAQFVVTGRAGKDDVAEDKIDFFFAYPDLVTLRKEIASEL